MTTTRWFAEYESHARPEFRVVSSVDRHADGWCFRRAFPIRESRFGKFIGDERLSRGEREKGKDAPCHAMKRDKVGAHTRRGDLFGGCGLGWGT